MERRTGDGPGRSPGRHRSPEKPPPAAGRGRLLTAAVVVFVLVGTSLVGWALLNESPPEPRAAGCAPDCAVPEPTEPSGPAPPSGTPVASDSVQSPTPSPSTSETPTTEASETPDREDDDDRWRGHGRGDRGDRDDDDHRGGPRLRTDYSTRGDWETNFIGAITVTNHTERPVEAGRLVFGYRRGVDITSAWGVPNRRGDGSVSAQLGVLGPGASVTVTFQAAGEASSPDHCSLDGRSCG